MKKDGEHHWWETLLGWSPTATGVFNLMLHPIVILLTLMFPWSPSHKSREPGGGREIATLGWSSAAELGRAPGTEGAHGKWAELQRDSSAQEQQLCKAQQG
ncbi:hypothetical protein QYF61_021388 [Mycteria americana]|uniref:Uncharacterized protein n=1 Tax=Mycteria americana TaxID=33587 RepID=A0AAN7RJH9_MYCAM|nr:hypothetical protein QYF61_013955 [Mycteria americana]KAK4806552.1 hypothetical protein QYF61_021388 [Mycteria americana]